MLGRVEHITTDCSSQTWHLDMDGFRFEDHVTSVIQHSLENLYQYGLTVEKTPRTRDNGKDIVIRSPTPFTLFGKQFDLCGKSSICIYIELKSSSERQIQLDRFSKNILIANDSQIDYWVLLTNATITPYSFFEAEKNAKEHGYIFYLVDQYPLFRFLARENAMYGEYTSLEHVPDVSISYQIDHSKQDGLPYLTLYILFHNISESTQICSFQLITDRNWLLSETSFDVFLDAGAGHCRRICIQKEYFDGMDDMVIAIETNSGQKHVTIRGSAIDYVFETPLIGKQHYALIEEIYNKIGSITKSVGFGIADITPAACVE